MYTEKDMKKIIRQRDQAERVVDNIKDMLGIKEEWSNRYGYEDFLEDAKAIIANVPADEPDESGICTHCGFPRKLPGEPCELCHNV